jgi:23S rRNA (uracil1939-C5)-methyltransferase
MVELVIERLGHQGDGIAPGPVFAARTLPGERVSGRLEGSRLEDVKIVEPASERVQAVCRHYKGCGGCGLQHASDAFVAEWKVEIVRAALAGHGIEAAFRPIHTSAAQTRRRAVFAVRRTKKGALVGFHGRASDTIVEIPDCQLLVPELLGALPICERLALVGGSRKGVMAVTATATRAGLDLSVSGGKPMDGQLFAQLAQVAEAVGVARLAWDGEIVVQRVPPAQVFGAAQVVPPSGAFLQATQDGESALVASVREAVGEARRVVDLFAGCGTFSLPLADTAEVHAVEGAAPMMVALDQGWRHASGLRKVTTEARDLFRRPLMPDELAKFDAVVLDPPRAGAEAQVREIAQAKRPVLAYVSCNPVTFARDAKVLIDAGYRLDWVQVVDQFRWSAHVELAARFVLDHINGD